MAKIEREYFRATFQNFQKKWSDKPRLYYCATFWKKAKKVERVNTARSDKDAKFEILGSNYLWVKIFVIITLLFHFAYFAWASEFPVNMRFVEVEDAKFDIYGQYYSWVQVGVPIVRFFHLGHFAWTGSSSW